MKDEILEYIRKHVTEWPEGAEEVFLCRSGEISFDCDEDKFDRTPKDRFEGVFVPCEGYNNCSETYTREQWQPVINLETIDKPFGKLDRKTQLRLVEHVLDGGSVNIYSENTWYSEDYRDVVCFCSGSIYRAKPSRRD